jgi:hypothetical protein
LGTTEYDVGLDVVGVTVDAALVVGHHDRGVLLVEDRRDTTRGGLHVDVHEGVGAFILWPAQHPRVVVAEVDRARKAQRRHGPL